MFSWIKQRPLRPPTPCARILEPVTCSTRCAPALGETRLNPWVSPATGHQNQCPIQARPQGSSSADPQAPVSGHCRLHGPEGAGITQGSNPGPSLPCCQQQQQLPFWKQHPLHIRQPPAKVLLAQITSVQGNPRGKGAQWTPFSNDLPINHTVTNINVESAPPNTWHQSTEHLPPHLEFEVI